MNIKKIGLSLLIFILLAIPVMAEEETEKAENIAAIVNGEEIEVNTVDQYANLNQFLIQLLQSNREFAQVLLSTEAGKEVLNEYRKIVIEGLIMEKLLVGEAEERNLTISQEKQDEIFNRQIEYILTQQGMTEEQLVEALKGEGFDSLEAYKEAFLQNNEKQFLLGELQNAILDPLSVDIQDVEAYYNENIEQYNYEAEIRASHILLETEEKALEVLDKINNGADFAELAREYSTGPSGEKGGDLGFFGQNSNMDKDFKDAAFALELNKVSKPIKTQFGYHLIKVTEMKEAGTTTFEEAKDTINEQLLSAKKQEKWNEFVTELREKAEIEIRL
ncbi:MAG: peptidylprolyl isomerase [Halanaerobiales bacterium]|nr:peptidylprolyl isomerase [Halanaerobiales bacterium]